MEECCNRFVVDYGEMPDEEIVEQFRNGDEMTRNI